MRKQEERPSHELWSFARYLNKVFAFRSASDRLTDSRHQPEISAPAVFRAVFYGLVFRLTSFQQLQSDIAQPAFQRWIGVERAFGDDVLRYSLCGFDLSALETMLVQVNRTLKRNKGLDSGRVQGRIVAALDGIEVLSSYSRCCQACLERRISYAQADGTPCERIQYYHRAVGCQIVSGPVKPILAIEWLRPGEGEDTAALRLFRRMAELYGNRFFDILLLDSLYAQAPVLRLTQDCPLPVRVVRSEEEVTRRKIQGGKPCLETTRQQWLWISTLEDQAFPAQLIWQLGHLRWKNENNGWNDLTQNWALKHGFLHACKHRPKTVAPSGKLQSVPNRGLAAVVLILCLAFTLFSAFALLHSKLLRRYRLALVEVARQLHRSLWQLSPPIRSPAHSVGS